MHRRPALPARGPLVWAAAVTLAALVTLGLLGGRWQLERRLAGIERDFEEVDRLETAHRNLTRGRSPGRAAAPPLARAEAAVRRALRHGRLAGSATDAGGVRIELTEIPLAEVVSVLHEIETGEGAFVIRSLDMRRTGAEEADQRSGRRLEVVIETGTPSTGPPR
jgi:hypothetical protein